jgi:sigma-B regulation protein RsbU (phosphoserine phosphatase)
MNAPIVETIRSHLSGRRATLLDWIRATSANKKTQQLGPVPEGAVQAHLGSVERSLALADAGSLGVCKVCHEQVDSALLEVDYTASVCLDHLSEEERRHLERDLELARNVQRTLLPQEAPREWGMELAAFSRPARIVGGDYFDFVDFRGGSHGLVIADVAGHGVSAGMGMASLQALLRAIIPASDSPASVVGHIQRLFVHNIRISTFATAFLGAFDPVSKQLTYCNAGHNPPLLLRDSGPGKPSVSWLEPTGAAIALVEDLEFDETTVELHPRDLVVMYTDGVPEAVDQDFNMFGHERLEDSVRRLGHLPAREVVRGVTEIVEQFTAGKPPEDDMTIVAWRVS